MKLIHFLLIKCPTMTAINNDKINKRSEIPHQSHLAMTFLFQIFHSLVTLIN